MNIELNKTYKRKPHVLEIPEDEITPILTFTDMGKDYVVFRTEGSYFEYRVVKEKVFEAMLAVGDINE